MPARCKAKHGLLELADLAAGLAVDGVAAVRREQRQRIVAPVVRPRGRLAVPIVHGELEDRHQLDRGHAQRLQVGDLLDQAQVRAAMGHVARLVASEAADVHLVDHRLVQAAAQVAIPLPVELVADDHALRRPNHAVRRRQEIARQGLGIGIDQPRPAVEAESPIGIERPVGLKMIKLTGADARHKDAPDIAPAVLLGIQRNDFGRLRIEGRIIKQHPHRRRRAAENDELHPPVVEYCAERNGV